MDRIRWDQLILRFRYPLLFLLGGLILLLGGIFYNKSGLFSGGTKVEVLDATSSANISSVITVEIAGSVQTAGVYKLSFGSRVEDLLIASGGFSGEADRVWIDKYLNRAAKLNDGQKVYIPKIGEQLGTSTAKTNGGDQTASASFSSDSDGLVNVNNASLNELDKLPGIGPVYGQSIIEHRPYSTVEELLSKGALKKSVYEKIKDMVSIY